MAQAQTADNPQRISAPSRSRAAAAGGALQNRRRLARLRWPYDEKERSHYDILQQSKSTSFEGWDRGWMSHHRPASGLPRAAAARHASPNPEPTSSTVWSIGTAIRTG